MAHFHGQDRLDDHFSSDRIAHMVDVLRDHAQHKPEQLAFTFLKNGEEPLEPLTFGQLDARARAIASRMQAQNLAGERAVMLYPTHYEFICAFFGCLYAGVVAVPCSLPQHRIRGWERIAGIMLDCTPKIVLTMSDLKENLETTAREQLGGVQILATDEIAESDSALWRYPEIDLKDLAFLQYTSGSTGNPKGVMVSQGNLVSNEYWIRRGVETKPHESTMISWLPVFHDMGLIGKILHPVYAGCHCVLMSPAAFIQRPVRWLEAISRYRGNISSAPNFAYELCAERVTDEELAKLDLSSWLFACNGAEPIRAETLARFTERFVACGFRPQTHTPCYGMAETTLMVSGCPKDQDPVLMTVDGQAFENNRAVPVDESAEKALTLVSSGRALGHEIVIVDPHTLRLCDDGQVGEIWIHGPSVAAGYWGKTDLTEETFRARIQGDPRHWLRTGDLGFLVKGELFVTGRLKDLIIIRGRNIYPQDIEEAVNFSHPALTIGGAASFSVDTDQGEALVVVQEIRRTFLNKVPFETLLDAVREALAQRFEVGVHDLVILPPGQLSKTTSGKVQRRKSKALYLAGQLPALWQSSKAAAPVPEPEIAQQNQEPPPQVQRTKLETWLVEVVAAEAGLPTHQISTRKTFSQMGLGSVNMIRLSGRLSDELHQPVPPTLFYDYPTISGLLAHLCGEPVAETATVEAAVPGMGQGVAVIGIGCRFPGMATGPGRFWNMLLQGVNAVGEVPSDRFDVAAHYGGSEPRLGKTTSKWGGYIQNIDLFDAAFFGLSSREAVHIDPQQRLLLEVTWHALEHAGIPPGKLAGSATGVFVGICTNDYGYLYPHNVDYSAYTGTGNALSIAANRLSFLLDLRGPSMAIDTACSSSLAAVHGALGALAEGSCDLAVAGGVNLIMRPDLSIMFSQATLMSPTGSCKAFDAGADGYVRSEGLGMIVLKPLARAQADGDRILAVIKGSAVNQDGRSNGLSAPNGLAQQEVVRKALQRAGVAPKQVSYVECHGTGTVLGDPIEIGALQATYGRERDQPLWVGSVKSNLGHLEAAAGVAGLIKAVLALHHKTLPKSLHFNQPNPHIPWNDLRVKVNDQNRAWETGESPRMAGVSSFGFGGTNVHVILAEAEAAHGLERPPNQPVRHLLGLSAKSPGALKQKALDLLWALEGEPHLGDLCYTNNVHREHFAFRAYFQARNLAELGEALATFAPRAEEQEADRAPRVGFLFSGQGSNYVGMGRVLYESLPRFRNYLDEAVAAVQPHLEHPLLEAMWDTENPRIQEIHMAQPATFAIQVALAKCLRDWGVRPDWVLGHSSGEVAAAHIAGIVDLSGAATLVCTRSRMMHTLCPPGRMMAVRTNVTTLEPLLAPYEGKLSIAAINGPENVVVSGDAASIEALAEELRGREIKPTILGISCASHSPLMQPMLAPFREVVEQQNLKQPEIPYVSGMTAGMEDRAPATVDYWVNHVSQPVRFAQAVETLHGGGCDLMVEIGPDNMLVGMAAQCLPADGPALYCQTLAEEGDGWQQLLDFLGLLYVRGWDLDWRLFHEGQGSRFIDLPTYPFQGERFWLETAREAPVVAETHALPGRHIPTPLSGLAQYEMPLFLEHSALAAWRQVDVLAPGTGGALDVILAVMAAVKGSKAYYRVNSQGPAAFPATRGDDNLVLQTVFWNPGRDQAKISLHQAKASFTAMPENWSDVWEVALEQSDDPGPAKIDKPLPAQDLEAARAKLESWGWRQPLAHVAPGGLYASEGRILARMLPALHGTSLGETPFAAVAQLAHLLREPNAAGTSLQIHEVHDLIVGSSTSGAWWLALELSGEERGHPRFQLTCCDDTEKILLSGAISCRLWSHETWAAHHASLRRDWLYQLDWESAALAPLQPLSSWLPAPAALAAPQPGQSPESSFEALLPAILANAPKYRTIRVLEIGTELWASGQAALQKAVDAGASLHYTVSDPSAGMLARLEAQKTFAGTRFQRLDLAEPLGEQGMETGVYDLVVAGRGLGGQPQLDQALRNVATLLAPEGLLVSLEPGPDAAGEAPVPNRPWETLLSEAGLEHVSSLGQGTACQRVSARKGPTASLPFFLFMANGCRLADAIAAHLHKIGIPCAATPKTVTHAEELDNLVRDSGCGAEQTLHVCYFPPGGGPNQPLSERVMAQTLDLLGLVKTLADRTSVRLTMIARGLYQPDAEPSLALSPLCGLARVVDMEIPELPLRRIDIGEGGDDEALTPQLVRELVEPDGEKEIRFRAGGREVLRLDHLAWAEAPYPPVEPKGAYLVTGGLGGLGLAVADWLAQEGAGAIYLLGRRMDRPDLEPNLEAMRAKGSRVFLMTCDVGDAASLDETMSRVAAGPYPLKGVLHAAGQLSDAVIRHQDRAHFQDVFRAKVDGGWNLHLATRDADLDWFVLFSSMAAIVGPPGQANHAAGNAFLDGLAAFRRAQGLPATTINWGPWSEIGAAAEKLDKNPFSKAVTGISPGRGMAIWHELVRSGMVTSVGQLAVLPVNWPAFGTLMARLLGVSGRIRPGFYQRLLATTAVEEKPLLDADALRAAEPQQRPDLICDYLKGILAATMQVSPQKINAREPVSQLGLDSLMAVELRNRCQRDLGLNLPFAKLLGGPSLRQLAAELAEEWQQAETMAQAANAPVEMEVIEL